MQQIKLPHFPDVDEVRFSGSRLILPAAKVQRWLFVGKKSDRRVIASLLEHFFFWLEQTQATTS